MTIALNVQADVINIASDSPQPDDIFLVDTNVWLWQTYLSSQLSSPAFTDFSSSTPRRSGDRRKAQNKITQYTPYIKKALVANSKLLYVGLIFSELAHIIENFEYEIYKNTNGLSNLDIKEFRHSLSSQRSNVVFKVKEVWEEIEELGNSADVFINDKTTQSALARFQTQALDGYDLFLLEAVSQTGSKRIQVLTDDMDYATVKGIQVFTSNGLTIQEARVQNKLLVR